MATELSRRLTHLASAAGYGKDRERSVADLHRLLKASHGVDCTRAALDHWLQGTRVPRIKHLVGLLDALSVPTVDRDHLIRLVLDPEGVALQAPNRPEDEPTELDNPVSE